jgi:hypothetical protein
MTSNREQTARGAARRRRTQPDQETHLERRRAEMHAAEGHAGSIPRGNQEPEQDDLVQRRHEWDRVLGH